MSEHKIPLKKRVALGLTGIRHPPRGASAEARSIANRRRKYAGWRVKPWHALPGDAREYGKLNGGQSADEQAIAARLAKVDAERATAKEAA